MKVLLWFTISLATTTAWSATVRAEGDAYPQAVWFYNQSNTNSATIQNAQSDRAIGWIPKGVTITVHTCGANNGTDTYVRVLGSQNSTVAEDDDSCGSGSSYLTYTATKTEELTIRAGCYSSTACNAKVTVTANTSVARRYAPVLYASVFNSPPYSPKADHITNFDFDGDFIATNNRANTPSKDHYAYVYFSNVETSTAWYPSYYFFHSDDNTSNGHENDLEGVQFQIKKDGTFYGQMWVMQVERHGGIYFYTNQPNISGVSPGGITLEPDTAGPNAANHPKVYIEPRGHGVHTCTASSCNPNSVSGGTGTGIIYRLGNSPQKPGEAGTNSGSTVWSMSGAVSYALIGLSDHGRWDHAWGPGVPVGLYALRWNPNVMIAPASGFNSNGNMKGNPAGATIPFGKTGSGNGWGAYGRWVCNPAAQFFGNLGGMNNMALNTTYSMNAYAGTGVALGSPSASSCLDQ